MNISFRRKVSSASVFLVFDRSLALQTAKATSQGDVFTRIDTELILAISIPSDCRMVHMAHWATLTNYNGSTNVCAFDFSNIVEADANKSFTQQRNNLRTNPIGIPSLVLPPFLMFVRTPRCGGKNKQLKTKIILFD